LLPDYSEYSLVLIVVISHFIGFKTFNSITVLEAPVQVKPAAPRWRRPPLNLRRGRRTSSLISRCLR
jgi:hypothetical protein